MPEQLLFLKSVRFWKLFAIAVVEFLASQGVLTKEVANAVAVLLGGSVLIRTLDREVDKLSGSQ